MTNRRMFMGKLAAIVTAGPKPIVRASDDTMQYLQSLSGAVTTANRSDMMPGPPAEPDKLKQWAWKWFHKERRRATVAKRAQNYRIEMSGGMDPDLAVLRSMSHSVKLLIMQKRMEERNKDNVSQVEKVIRMVGLDKFEDEIEDHIYEHY